MVLTDVDCAENRFVGGLHLSHEVANLCVEMSALSVLWLTLMSVGPATSWTRK